MNIQGYDSIDEVLERGIRPLSPNEFEAAANETGAMILDMRSYRKAMANSTPQAALSGTWISTPRALPWNSLQVEADRFFWRNTPLVASVDGH